MALEIVTVVNNLDQYNQLIANNIFLKGYKKILFDNSIENIAITKRYNNYINELMPDDCWIVFCHQDFEFREEIHHKLELLDKSNIYGPIGASVISRFCIYLRWDWERFKKFRIGRSNRLFTIGEIMEYKKGKFKNVGVRLHSNEIVDTVDCCCLIVHSSLVKKYNLKFDENLDWHSYSEDFSLNAKFNFNVLTRIVQLEATHYSSGSFNDGLKKAIAYLRSKYNNRPFASTCFDGYYYNFINRIKA